MALLNRAIEYLGGVVIAAIVAVVAGLLIAIEWRPVRWLRIKIGNGLYWTVVWIENVVLDRAALSLAGIVLAIHGGILASPTRGALELMAAICLGVFANLWRDR